MPRKAKYIAAGTRFGRFTVVQEIDKGVRHRHFRCLCDCGSIKDVSLNNLRSGATKSCGCLRRETLLKHGDIGTPLYRIWAAMKARCLNPKTEAFKNYGGRGIKLDPAWHDYRAFYSDMGGRYRAGLQIDRIDNDGPYSSSNCRWVSRAENQRNKRNNHNITYSGTTHCLSEWSRVLAIPRDTLASRIKRGWSVKKAFTTPVANKTRGNSMC